MDLEQGLAPKLAQTLEDARRTWAAWRPEVAEYLFEKGFRRAEAALPPGPESEALLHALFRLQMESIGARTFGVSNDAWRDNRGWPDRYFPILWIDLLPNLLPRLPVERRLSELVSLFNLGENLVLVAPTLGGLVAEGLLARRESIVLGGVEAVSLAVLVELGIVPATAVPEGARARPTTLRAIARVSLAQWEGSIVPAAVSFSAEGALQIADATRPFALQLGSPSAQLLGRVTLDAVPPPRPLPLSHAELTVRADGVVRVGEQTLGTIDPRGVHSAAINAHGVIAISRRFSQVVEVWGVS